jgi:hypothetical protein
MVAVECVVLSVSESAFFNFFNGFPNWSFNVNVYAPPNVVPEFRADETNTAYQRPV